jgi:spore maturation protein CgeB
MSSALFVGITSHGTTSESQAKWLERLTPDFSWERVDTDAVFLPQPRWSRSLAFRLRIGPAVQAVNQQVLRQIEERKYDLIWINKGVVLWPETIQKLRRQTACLIHYTPDTAFHQNRSRFFFKTLSLYDLLVTTKSFEMDEYRRRVPGNKIHLTTQGYDPDVHHLMPQVPKCKSAILIGLCEPHRENCVHVLRKAGVPLRIGGKGWERVAVTYSHDPDFEFLGSSVFGEAYSTALASSAIGLGLLSKRFPELHTTRTMEIPACGTLLATERTSETSAFFAENEALFFGGFEDLARQAKALLEKPEELRSRTEQCHAALVSKPFAYPQIVGNILSAAGIAHQEWVRPAAE